VIVSPPIVAWATVGPFRQNSYVLGDPDTKEAVLVDPGVEPGSEERRVGKEGRSRGSAHD